MNLFDQKELSRADKMRISRKITNKLTSDAIDWLNSTGHFTVHRQNNIPSTRLANEEKQIEGKLANGQLVTVIAVIPVVYHKKNQKEFALLDIAGYRLSDGKHVEIEVKSGKDTLSSDQKERIEMLKKAECISFAFSDMETLRIQIKPFMADPKLAF